MKIKNGLADLRFFAYFQIIKSPNFQIDLLTKTELITQLAATFGKTKVDKLTVILKDGQFDLRDLIDLTFHSDKTIAYRAAWLLENLFWVDPEKYLPDMDCLLARFTAVKYPSCQRHYAKIMAHITSPKASPAIKKAVQQADLEPVVEKLFDWMIDPEILIAVKVHAGEALFNLRSRYPWLAEELANQLHFLMRNGTAAIQARGKKLLAALGNSVN